MNKQKVAASVFERGLHLDPRYQFLEKYVHIMYRGFWTPAKYEKGIKDIDVPHFENVLGNVDKEVIRRCILAVSIVEDKVKTYWPTLAIDLPQTIIGDTGGLFGQSEVTHRRSYHSLAEQLNVNLQDVEKHEVLKGRVEYLSKYLEPDVKMVGKKRILKKLILFTALVERCSLFTQFYIIMSYAYRNRGLSTMSALQESTAIEEDVHYSFGIDIINIIKQQEPLLWDDYLTELVENNIKKAYESELKLIDWFFENGVPEHLEKDEVINFLNYNFNVVCKDLKLNLSYAVDEKLFSEKNSWFTTKVFMTSESDFFSTMVSSYASDDEEVNLDSFNF